jgi:truncated hemoglobin YjbI
MTTKKLQAIRQSELEKQRNLVAKWTEYLSQPDLTEEQRYGAKQIREYHQERMDPSWRKSEAQRLRKMRNETCVLIRRL